MYADLADEDVERVLQVVCGKMNSFYTDSELKEIGFKSVGSNILLSRKASIYSPEKISIGNNVRIDDFCILSGNITIGNYCRIAAYCARGYSNVVKFCGCSCISLRSAA